MKKRKNTAAKIVAFIALLAIIIWIVGTGILVIANYFSESNYNNTEITEEQLQEYLETLSWSTTIQAEEIE